MGWLLALLLGSLALYGGSCMYTLARNYIVAVHSGIPFFVAPIPGYNILWLILGPQYQTLLGKYLPAFLWERLHHTVYGWEQRRAPLSARRYGSIFMVVTMGPVEIFVTDPDITHDIMKRNKDFWLNDLGVVIMARFGPNLITVQGAAWTRQRKFIAAIINEKVSATVFQESKAQAEQMLGFLERSKGTTNNMAEGFKQIAANVLGGAAYGQPRPWDPEGGTDHPPKGFTVSYRLVRAMRLCMDHIIEMAMMSPRLLLLPFMPTYMNQVGHAVRELPALTQHLLEQARENLVDRATITSGLVAERAAGDKGGPQLLDDEVNGNLFVFSAAGTDTTANTMAYALGLVAIYPEWQAWIGDEIDEVLAGQGDDLDYNEIYPHLVRTLAVMYETLRHFPPLTHMTREAHVPQAVTDRSGKTWTIPPKATVNMTPYALHMDPVVWSTDPLHPAEEFYPPRFLAEAADDDDPANAAAANADQDGPRPGPKKPFIRPLPKGSFVPWSLGPRVCPGQKMSQVEFVTVFMCVFRRWRVELVRRGPDETEEAARRRAWAVLRDSAPRLTMQMNRPRELEVRFVRR